MGAKKDNENEDLNDNQDDYNGGTKVNLKLNEQLNLDNYKTVSQQELDQVNELVLNNLDKNEAFSKWFNTSWEVRTEVPIVNPKGKDIRIDRVHINGNQVEIIDFKTGAKKAADIKQVKTYQSVLRTMGFEKVNGYLAYLDPFEIVEEKFPSFLILAVGVSRIPVTP